MTLNIEPLPRSLTIGVIVSILAILLPMQLVIAEPSAHSAGTDAIKENTSVIANTGFNIQVERLVRSVTAYSSTIGQTDDSPFIAANGYRVYSGLIACPRRYEFGTKVIMNHNDEEQVYTCGDRMNKRFDTNTEDERFDIWMESYKSAKQWGNKKIELTVISTI